MRMNQDWKKCVLNIYKSRIQKLKMYGNVKFDDGEGC